MGTNQAIKQMESGVVFPDETLGLEKSALDIQVGGNHYKNLEIQPAEYIQRNKLNWCEGNCVKYASRHESKGGAEDVKKIIHYAQMLLEFRYGIKCTVMYE